MKSWLAMSLLLVLQAALSPLCFCHGMPGSDSGAALASCCHHEAPRQAPNPTDHCPHCDEVEGFHLASSVKAVIVPEAVGVNAPDCPSGDVADCRNAGSDEIVTPIAGSDDPVPLRHSVRALLAVFVI